MRTKTIAASQLKKGNVIVAADKSASRQSFTVLSVQSLGAVVIVDFADNTASPPVPSNTAVTIEA